MDLKQIEYFVRVAELGSFTRAASALNIAQPALSRQVRLLEVELRQNLLVRNGRGAVPTEAGKLLLEHGRGILHQVERAREELGRVRGALAGRVVVGLPPSIARALAVALIHAFREAMPQAALSITEALSTPMLESLASGRLDIAILYNATPSPEIELTHLFDEDLFLVQARSAGQATKAKSSPGPTSGRAMPLRELAQLPLVIPSRPHAIRMQVEGELATLGLKPTIALEVDGVASILELVADGAGSAVLAGQAVRSSGRPSAFITRAIGSPRLRSSVSMAVSSQRPTTLTQKSTQDLLRELAGRIATA
ncbi:MAG: LysR substrate-binding domain-containing protein [Ramlibacter sp.]|uniref:LysR substrate-binding domain-containing protein n=1 Tax=Ramlibacter sp. TaxID=1917967 RepID=UPI0026180E1B|nr:LysR substrate-binding domain-containing protein [Ramlibacter sp.]MDH4377054.1 LysR substrate-binding domain-containing protein [Ramlibacter sp.]